MVMPAFAPPKPPPNCRSGAPLAPGPKANPLPPLPPLPNRPVPALAVSGAVARPAANATPPTATTSATPRRTLTKTDAPERFFAGAGTGAAGWTGAGANAAPGVTVEPGEA